jgi:hypothetical protein
MRTAAAFSGEHALARAGMARYIQGLIHCLQSTAACSPIGGKGLLLLCGKAPTGSSTDLPVYLPKGLTVGSNYVKELEKPAIS